jgi:hypothetical protein
MHLYAIVAGIGRVQNTDSLIQNGLLPGLLGLPDLPQQDTLRDFLKKFNQQSLKSLQSAHDKIRQKFFKQFGPLYSSIIDIDTTVLTTYGHQEGSNIGYNPTHRGKTSYCPILLSEGKRGFTLNFELRSGNVHSSTGVVPLLKETLDKLPQTVANSRTRIRADAAFFDKDIVHFLDDYNLQYVIVGKLYSTIKKILPGVKYHPYQENWSAGEFRYQPHFWKKPHRFIAIRSIVKQTDPAPTLFSVKEYAYRVLVTNLDLSPEKVWKIYCYRANQELLIRELKTSYAIAKIPTGLFTANRVYLEIALLAHDLMMAFKYSCLPIEQQIWKLETIRRNIFQLSAELVHPDHYNLLRLPSRFPHKEIFTHIQRAVTKVTPIT